ncbi:Outer membrane lipoprotein carrier protein LolA [Coxiella-like endosymbiont]|nr:outer membrane lipoprotein chaperone LolA [Coxiella endosymbiont of Rhipicephalus microplus]PMB54651.1 Outer membrane lipoprotein carrier protein LolA [Coxiella-like endosymbiont]
MNYKINLFFFILFLLTIPLVGISVKKPDAASQLSQLLSSFNTYQATFRQTTFDSEKRVIQKSWGRIMLKRPRNFRWETNIFTNQIIITNGKSLWIYNKDLSQAIQQPLERRKTITPVSFLSGSIKDLKPNFTIKSSLNNGTIMFELVPRIKKNLNFKWIQLKFTQKKLTELTLLNQLEERSIFRFKHIKINQPLADYLFQLKPSHDVDIIKQ